MLLSIAALARASLRLSGRANETLVSPVLASSAASFRLVSGSESGSKYNKSKVATKSKVKGKERSWLPEAPKNSDALDEELADIRRALFASDPQHAAAPDGNNAQGTGGAMAAQGGREVSRNELLRARDQLRTRAARELSEELLRFGEDDDVLASPQRSQRLSSPERVSSAHSAVKANVTEAEEAGAADVDSFGEAVSLAELSEAERTLAQADSDSSADADAATAPNADSTRARLLQVDPSRVAARVAAHVGNKDAVDLLRLKYSYAEPSAEERAAVEASALQLLDLLELPITPNDVLRRQRVLLKSEEDRDLSRYEQQYGTDLRAYTRYMRAVAEDGDYERAEAALSRVRALGLVPDAHVYSALFVAYERASRGAMGEMARRARAAATAMAADGVALSAPLVGAYVGVLCADVAATAAGGAQLDAAFALVEALRKSAREGEAALSLPVYTTLIRGCVRVRDYKRAWATFDHVKVWHFDTAKPDSVLYSLMIHVCALTGEAERALNLFDEMRALDVPPTSVTFAALIGAFRYRPDMHSSALATLADMKASGYAPDAHTWLALLQTMAGAGDLATAQLVFDELQRLPVSALERASLPHNLWLRAYTALITAHVYALRRPGVLRSKRGEELLSACEGVWARYVAQCCGGDEAQASVHARDAMLRLYCEAQRVNRAWTWRDRYDALGVQPTIVTYKALLKLLCRTRRVERALELFAQMQREPLSLVPDVQSYAHLIDGCSRVHYVSTGMRLLREMKQRGLPLQPHFLFVLNFRRHLTKSPHLVREIDELTGKARQFLPGWKRPGGRHDRARMRTIGKEEREMLAKEPKFPLAQNVHAVSGSAGM